MKVFPKCQKNQCLIRRPKVRIALGLASNNFIYLLSNTALCAGCFGNDFILVAYCRDNLAHLSPKLGSCASTYKLSIGEVRNAPRQSLSPWSCMGFSICKRRRCIHFLRWSACCLTVDIFMRCWLTRRGCLSWVNDSCCSRSFIFACSAVSVACCSCCFSRTPAISRFTSLQQKTTLCTTSPIAN